MNMLKCLLLATLAGACHEPSPRAAAARTPGDEATSGAAADDRRDAQLALDALDGRAPVPLLPMMAHHQKENMRDHLLAVQEIVIGTAAGDFAAVERAATRIGSSEQMQQMCSRMGSGAPGFTEQALNFHRTADGIAEAARQRDTPAVLSALGATLQTCTGCHAVFRQDIVGESEWTRRALGLASPLHAPR